MMLIQYPRVLRDRYDQIVEAQVARGADRPKSIAQRLSHGASLLLPVMQSELNAVGERAALIHLRGLDVDVPHGVQSARSVADAVVLLVAITAVIAASALRIVGR
jgi:energy-coupling factor transporter transmembrane protein EcfT